MRILTLTTLYPNAASPAHGVFVENRLRAFKNKNGGDVRVIAPVPWFPVAAGWAGKYAQYARAPKSETRHGVRIDHPRYVIPPKVGMTYAAYALERCFYGQAERLLRDGWDFDLIDAHYFYPDGVAAARVAKRLGKPIVITARGTDVNLLPRYPRQCAMILEATYQADAIIAVAAALRDEMVRIGAPAEKISVLRNGVDLETFAPSDREAARRNLGLTGDVVVSVGHLIERKGHHLVIEALRELPETTLLVVGDGEERARLEALSRRIGVADRVRFLGSLPHDELAQIYTASDALALASSREGWPNVLLESMACGTPAVASPVWGSVEVITAPELGRLARERTAPAIAEALRELLSTRPPRAATRRYAERFSWDETAEALNSLFGSIIKQRSHTALVMTTPTKVKRDDARPRMIITVDTEEAFDWSRFDKPPVRVCPPADIDRLQQCVAGFGAKPLYLLTYPLIVDEACAAYFRDLQRSGAADLGLHLHQWVTPPTAGYDGEYYSWQSNLPPEVQRAKMRALANAFERAFGFRARAHRAGRYGASPASYDALAAVGVDLDFSPSAGFDFSRAGGPDFSAMGNAPFMLRSGEAPPIAVTPVCAAWAIKGGRHCFAHAAPPGFEGAPFRLPRRLATPVRLTCEGVGFDDLKALARRLVASRCPVLTFSLHSTSMTPGANPYAGDEAAVAAMLDVCERFFGFYRDELNGVFINERGLADAYGS